MLKHEDLLKNLSSLEKAAIVTSPLTDESLKGAGLPLMGKTSLEVLAKEKGISYSCAARTFDPALVGRMTEELVKEAGANGGKLFVTPDLKPVFDPCAEGMTEDPVFASGIAAALVDAVHGAGGAVALSQLSLTAEKTRYLDRRADPEAMREFVVKPFAAARGADAIVMTPKRLGTGYNDTNRTFVHEVLGGELGDVFAICEDVSPTADAIRFLKGYVTLDGAALPIQRAVRRYKHLEQYRDEGSMTQKGVDDAVASGIALSEEKLAEAADDVIEFVEQVAASAVAPPAGDEARKQLASDCIVLLKNDGVLPLAAGSKVAVLGTAYEDETPLSSVFNIAAEAEGYGAFEERSEYLIPAALRAAADADAVLVFLAPEGGELPANRLALVDALVRAGRRVIALVMGDTPVPMGFDRGLAATLLVPEDGPYAAQALADVLSGAAEPTGRLARSYYDDESAFAWKKERDAGHIRVGVFAGYRRYDTAGIKVRYPFGFGLSYTTFAYSDLKIKDMTVTFTLKNTGKRAGSEVVQLYLGAPSLTRAMPKKTLAAYRKLSLLPGEKKTVVFQLSREMFETFDPDTQASGVEAGVYRIYVGASVSDIRLDGKCAVEGTVRRSRGDSYADYFEDSDYGDVERIRAAGRLIKPAPKAPRPLRIARRAAILAAPAIALVFFILITSLVFTEALDVGMLISYNSDAVKWTLYVLAIVVLALVPLFGSFNRKRLIHVRNGAMILCPILLYVCIILGVLLASAENTEVERMALIGVSCLAVGTPITAIVAALLERELYRSKTGANRWEKFYFTPKKEEQTTPDAVFDEAFAAARSEAQKKTDQPQPEAEEAPIPDAPAFYDKNLTYESMTADLGTYLSERGMAAEKGTVEDLIAAYSSCRLIFVPEGGGAELAAAAAAYFGAKPKIDNAEQYFRGEDLFLMWDQVGRMSVRTGLYAALTAAQKEGAILHTAILRHLPASRVGILSALGEVIARKRTAVSANGEALTLPSNLRIVVELAGSAALPADLAEVSACLTPVFETREEQAEKTALPLLGVERFGLLTRTVRDEFPLSESVWKNLDRLDERCKPHIPNQVWIKLELHASVLAACGEKEGDALRAAMAAELTPWLGATWEEAELSAAMDEIFAKQTKRSGKKR